MLALGRACRTSASCGCRARRTSGRPGRSARAGPAPSSTSTAGSTSAATDDRPGDDTERFLEFWNLVFMQYSLHEDGSLEPLPKRNIDTGAGLDRMAAILQDVPSVFENDQFRPLVELGEELSGRRYGSDFATTRALRVLADHSRAMTLPDRRRRRAVERGPRLHPAAGDAPRDPAGPLDRPRVAVPRPVRGPRDRGHGRRLPGAARRARRRSTSGSRPRRRASAARSSRARGCSRELVERAKAGGTSWIDARGRVPAARHLRLPVRPHARAAPAEGLSVDDAGFHELMEEQRDRARTGDGAAPTAPRTSTSGCRSSPGGPGSRPGSSATRRPR